jgi:uncharacterized membrane protein YuzA (DUF378 family)
MRRRTRKFIGAALMLAFVAVYALAAMLVAQSEPIGRLPGWGQGIFYAVVGLAWILPLMPLIAWMERPDSDDAAPGTL